MKCPRMDLVLLIETGWMFLGEGTEVSCGPQFASAKAAGIGVDELLSCTKGNMMKLSKLSFDHELNEMP